jgi:hypothetical protein
VAGAAAAAAAAEGEVVPVVAAVEAAAPASAASAAAAAADAAATAVAAPPTPAAETTTTKQQQRRAVAVAGARTHTEGWRAGKRRGAHDELGRRREAQRQTSRVAWVLLGRSLAVQRSSRVPSGVATWPAAGSRGYRPAREAFFPAARPSARPFVRPSLRQAVRPFARPWAGSGFSVARGPVARYKSFSCCALAG